VIHRSIFEAEQTEASALTVRTPDIVPFAVHKQIIETIQSACNESLSAERTRHQTEIERLRADHERERSFWVERADEAEVRAGAAEQRLADLSDKMADRLARPWWVWRLK
jgi:hypothetical protein